ncbi:hypothetical protein JCM8202v2_005759 [Rhodotorula sphaerocarpa]
MPRDDTSPARERPEGQPLDRFDRIRYQDLSDEASWVRIGKGSFGSVWKGEYLGLEVAIKEVLQSSEYDVEKYMAREITLMQQTRHPNIIQYLGLCLAPAPPVDPTEASTAPSTPRSRILIISEYLPRGNLREYILNRSLAFPWRLRISFATDIARALAYLHARNTMHRDLKGENLLVAENERLKACDFGLARVAQAANGHAAGAEEARKPSDMYTYCGTDGYMSPEILLGLPFDLRTDIYSLGILYLEIASRKLASQTVFARRPPDYSISHEEVWSSVSSACPRAFLDLALECCDEDPERRPDCKAILKRLRVIEQEVNERPARGLGDEDAHVRGGAAAGNVGSILFSGTLKRGSVAAPGHSRRPGAPLLPSFDGQIDLRRASTFAPAFPGDAGSSSFAGAERSIGHSRSHSGSEYSTDDEDGEALLALAHADIPIEPAGHGGDPDSDSEAHLIKVIRPSHLRGPYGRLGSTSGSQLPSLPSSWIHPSRLSEAEIQVDTDSDHGTVIVAPPKARVVAADTAGGASRFTNAGTVVEEGETDAESDVFHSAFQEPISSGLEEETLSAPHRFSLMRPGLQRFLGSLASSAGRPTSAIGTPQPVAGSVSRGKCAQCAKNLGLMKAFLTCDDCGWVP